MPSAAAAAASSAATQSSRSPPEGDTPGTDMYELYRARGQDLSPARVRTTRLLQRDPPGALGPGLHRSRQGARARRCRPSTNSFTPRAIASAAPVWYLRSEEHTSELQSRSD